MSQLEKVLLTEEGKRLHREIAQRYAKFRPFCDKEIELRRAGETKEATQTISNPEVTEARNELRKGVAEFLSFQKKLKDEVVKKQAATESSASAMLIGASDRRGHPRFCDRDLYRTIDNRRHLQHGERD
jgi:CHASE3 domain sensor protein